jgi:hypothetical protein
MIEVIGTGKSGIFEIHIAGELLEHTKAYVSESANRITLDVNSYEDTAKLCSCHLSDIPNNLKINLLAKNNIGFDENFLELTENLIRSIWVITLQRNEFVVIGIKFGTNLLRWRRQYTYYSYLEAFVKSKELFKHNNVEFEKQKESIVALIKFAPDKTTLSEAIYQSSSILYECHGEVERSILSEFGKEILKASFTFPEELKASCEQYLIYFAQFLQDLGINATSSLKEVAGQVLFSVTPKEDIVALDKIREALAVYLNLPASPIVYDDSFASMRLQQLIENLQHSQRMAVRELQYNEKLLIAQSDSIREKNLTISQQQSVIEQQNKIIEKISSKSIMMDSVENKEELEEIYDGLKIGKSEKLGKWLGVHLNPARVIKTAVKNAFKKDEIISILDSGEETDKNES